MMVSLPQEGNDAGGDADNSKHEININEAHSLAIGDGATVINGGSPPTGRGTRATDRPIFSKEATFSLLTGKPVVTNPTQLLNPYNNGQLDTTEMVSVSNGRSSAW